MICLDISAFIYSKFYYIITTMYLKMENDTKEKRTVGKRTPKKKSEAYKGILISTNIFKDREVSVLERLVEHMKDDHNLRFCDIAGMLNRGYGAIRTVYVRAREKRQKGGDGK